MELDPPYCDVIVDRYNLPAQDPLGNVSRCAIDPTCFSANTYRNAAWIGCPTTSYRSFTGRKPTRTVAFVWNPYRFQSRLLGAFRAHLHQ